MLKKFILKYYRQSLSRWVIFAIDVLLVVLFFFFAKLINYQSFYILKEGNTYIQLVIVTTIYIFAFLIKTPYKGIMRYTGSGDIRIIFKTCTLAFGILIGLKFITFIYPPLEDYLPWGREIVSLSAFTLVGMVFIRLGSRLLYDDFINSRKKEHYNIIIYGAGDAGKLTYNMLMQESDVKNTIIAFVDDNVSKVKKYLDGIPVLSPKKVLQESFIKRNRIDELIIAIPTIRIQSKQCIVKKGLELGLQVKSVPEVSKWINGQFSVNQIQNINIEDLLTRDPIVLDNTNITHELKDKIVLITGAAGSIGSELTRQVIAYSPSCTILIDNAESPMFELQFELQHTFPKEKMKFVIADVRDKKRIREIFEIYHPQVIFHAAAYKHVPFMEEQPYEAVSVNVFGTKNMADVSIQYGVQKFVMISTDKAVNPTNVMGASKRIAEIYTQCHTNETTHFITTRFGNVLGSSGSVIPLFKKQLEQGGPLTVTHKDITRYFMTIPEACNLVLEAGAMGTGGDIFVFDMGNPVKIYDLAKNMIRLSKMNHIEIQEVGLRPGEKLYEELLATKEDTLPTHHPKILRAQVRVYPTDKIDNEMGDLAKIMQTDNVFNLVAKIKNIVPEFISNNSIFEQLDKKP